ncbi:MAG: integrase core domain-containing protein [Planctomycetota bacterium]
MNSLPFLTRLIAATILARQNKSLIAEIAYLRTEIAYLHEQLPERHRFTFTDRWRKRLARAAGGVGWKRMAEIATIVKATTIRSWHRLLARGKLGMPRRKPGRLMTDTEIETVVVRMARENPTWGQMRIRGELLKLGIRLASRTVGAILDRHGFKPAPERSTDTTWKSFITEKADALVATDFFTVDTHGLFSTTTYYVLFAIHLATRKVEILGVTDHPNEAFMVQTVRNTTAEGGWLRQVGARYIIHDRGANFCAAWKGALQQAGVDPVAIPPRSPNLNAFAERWVRTVKRECVRRCWFLNYGGLYRALQEFVDHYNAERPHQGVGNRLLTGIPSVQAATQQSLTKLKARDVRCVSRCNGTIRHYYRAAA